MEQLLIAGIVCIFDVRSDVWQTHSYSTLLFQFFLFLFFVLFYMRFYLLGFFGSGLSATMKKTLCTEFRRIDWYAHRVRNVCQRSTCAVCPSHQQYNHSICTFSSSVSSIWCAIFFVVVCLVFIYFNSQFIFFYFRVRRSHIVMKCSSIVFSVFSSVWADMKCDIFIEFLSDITHRAHLLVSAHLAPTQSMRCANLFVFFCHQYFSMFRMFESLSAASLVCRSESKNQSKSTIKTYRKWKNHENIANDIWT